MKPINFALSFNQDQEHKLNNKESISSNKNFLWIFDKTTHTICKLYVYNYNEHESNNLIIIILKFRFKRLLVWIIAM